VGPYDWRYYLSWEGRISRRDYMVGQQVIGLAGLFAALAPFVLSMFWSPFAMGGLIFAFFLVLVAVLSIPGSSLLIRRAHDLGWPAALSLAALLVPLTLVLALFARFGAFGRDAAEAQWLEVATATPLVIAVFAFAGVLSFWLMLKRGQPEANQYGPAPLVESVPSE
jgi:uncharacterized membrane protein YhaH (DUF805 family)